MNVIIESEKAQIFQEKHALTNSTKKNNLKNQIKKNKKKKEVLVIQEKKERSVDVRSAGSKKSGKIKKNFLEDTGSAYEFGDYYQQISESSLIDLGLLSDTFNDDNQEKLIREKEEKEY